MVSNLAACTHGAVDAISPFSAESCSYVVITKYPCSLHRSLGCEAVTVFVPFSTFVLMAGDCCFTVGSIVCDAPSVTAEQQR